MPHSLIIGMTGSGKTSVATAMSGMYQQKGVKVIVLDPMLDPRWKADFITHNRGVFLQVMQHPETQSCAVFVDESGEMIGQHGKELFWLATRSRHAGHNVHFICQRAKQISPNVREQCEYLFMFKTALDSSKEIANDFNRPELQEANTLQQFEYFQCSRYGELNRLTIKP